MNADERLITAHHGDPVNDAIELHALDVGAGGAPTAYSLAIHGENGNGYGFRLEFHLAFHHGPAARGITNEVLLAIVADRLREFQKGPFPCQENADALLLAEQALQRLKDRALARADATA